MGIWSVSPNATNGDTTRLIVDCDTRDDVQIFVDAGSANVDVYVE